jgi:hypothetical protein
MLTVSYVRPLFVGDIWPSIKSWVAEVCDLTGGRRTAPKVLAELIDNVTSLWVAHDEDGEIKAFATTRIVPYDAVTLLLIELAGGEDMDSWATDENFDVFSKFAADNGCAGVEIYGRGRAWARKMSNQGLEEFSVAVEKRWDR